MVLLPQRGSNGVCYQGILLSELVVFQYSLLANESRRRVRVKGRAEGRREPSID
jgi:hypothetical protein